MTQNNINHSEISKQVIEWNTSIITEYKLKSLVTGIEKTLNNYSLYTKSWGDEITNLRPTKDYVSKHATMKQETAEFAWITLTLYVESVFTNQF